MTVGNSSASPTLASCISGVWNAPPTFSGVTRFTPSSFARADAASRPSGCSGDHDLARRVVVCDPARVRCGRARALGLFERCAEQRGHPAGVRICGRLRELGAAGGEADAGIEGETARGDQCGDLSERVTGEPDRPFGKWLHRLPRDQRREEHGKLRVPCASEDIVGSVGDEVREWLTERGFGAIDDRPRSVVTPEQSHTRFLRPLSGEDDRDTHK